MVDFNLDILESDSEEDFSFLIEEEETEYTVNIPKYHFLEVGIDSEFTQTEIISCQMACKGFINGKFFNYKFFIYHERYKEYFDRNMNFDQFYSKFTFCKDLKIISFNFDSYEKDDVESICLRIIGQILIDDRIISSDLDHIKIIMNLYFYYSMKDLYAFFGFNNIKNLLLPSKKGKKRSYIS